MNLGEHLLACAERHPEALAAAVTAARDEVDPSDGMHASAEYRRHLAGVLAGRTAARAYGLAVA